MKNLHSFINSGMLELYAMNLLNRSDCKDVEKIIVFNKAARVELDTIINAIEKYAAAYSCAPSSSLKNDVISRMHSM